MRNRPTGKATLAQKLGLNGLLAGSDGQEYDEDEEKISLINMAMNGSVKNYDNLSIKTDSDYDDRRSEMSMLRGSIDFLAKF